MGNYVVTLIRAHWERVKPELIKIDPNSSFHRAAPELFANHTISFIPLASEEQSV